MSIKSFFDRLTQPMEWVDGDALRDLGLTRSEMKTLQFARPEMGQQLRAMARKFGLDPHDITADRWQALDISLACATCKKAGACANFLTDRGSFSLSECANAPTYAALAEAKYPAS